MKGVFNRFVVSSVIAIAGIVSACNGTAVASDVPTIVVRTDSAVRSDATTILHFAYPTAQAVTGSLEGSWTQTSSGYVLDEKFTYTDSDGDAQSFTLRFDLDTDGAIRAIRTLDRSEWWPTFGTGNLLLAAIQSEARDQIDSARRANQQPPALAVMILKANDITDVLIAKLNLDR